jgi:hypothetical protein
LDTHSQSSARRSATRTFGIAIAIVPILDIADRTGVLTATMQLDASTWLQFTGQVAAFATLGFCAAWLLARNAPRDRTWFISACTAVELLYAFATGLRLSVVAGLLAMLLVFVQLRSAGAESAAHSEPLPR